MPKTAISQGICSSVTGSLTPVGVAWAGRPNQGERRPRRSEPGPGAGCAVRIAQRAARVLLWHITYHQWRPPCTQEDFDPLASPY